MNQNTYPHDLTGRWCVACHEILTPDGWKEIPIPFEKECIWEFCPNGILIEQYAHCRPMATKFYYSVDKLLMIDRSEYDVDGSRDRLIEDRYRISFTYDDRCVLYNLENGEAEPNGYTAKLELTRAVIKLYL